MRTRKTEMPSTPRCHEIPSDCAQTWLRHELVAAVAGLIAHGDGDRQGQGGERPRCRARPPGQPAAARRPTRATRQRRRRRRQEDEDGEVGKAGRGSRPPRPADHEGEDRREAEDDAERVLAHVAGLDSPRGRAGAARTSAAAAVHGAVDDPGVDHGGARTGRRPARAGRSRRRRRRRGTTPAAGTSGSSSGRSTRTSPQAPGEREADHRPRRRRPEPGPTAAATLVGRVVEGAAEHRAEPAQRGSSECTQGRSQDAADEGQHGQDHEGEPHHPRRFVRRRGAPGGPPDGLGPPVASPGEGR